MRLTLTLPAAALVMSLGAAQAATPFEGAPLRVSAKGTALPGKPHPYHAILSPISFRDGTGTLWTAPAAALTDGASIPPVLTGLVGAPDAPEFREAAALHDAYCGAGNEALPQYRSRGWEETHAMFHDALLAAGVGRAKARVMFAAVYLAGPRWDDPARSLDRVPAGALRREMAWCLRFIEIADPDRAGIEAWMRSREAALIAGTQAPPDFAALEDAS